MNVHVRPRPAGAGSRSGISLVGCFVADPAGSDTEVDAPLGVVRLPASAFCSPPATSAATSRPRPDATSGRSATSVPGTLTRAGSMSGTAPSKRGAFDSHGRLTPGSVIDKYRIDEVLGVGGFSVVYRAMHLILRTPVALKVILPSRAQAGADAVGRFCDEASLLARVDHPNVVRVMDVTRRGNMAYIVMEHVRGGTLSDIIRKRGAIPADEAVRIGTEVSTGLSAALDKGFVHRDVKPGNILLTADGTAKIADFGVARRHVAFASVRDTDDSVSGTPQYMAPEQATSPDLADFRADIYSLGMTLYHAITGSPAFRHKDPKELLRMHVRAPVPRPETHVPGLPAQLSAVVMRMVEKEPSRRFANYTELIDALSACAAPRAAAAEPADPSTGLTRITSSLRRSFRRD